MLETIHYSGVIGLHAVNKLMIFRMFHRQRLKRGLLFIQFNFDMKVANMGGLHLRDYGLRYFISLSIIHCV